MIRSLKSKPLAQNQYQKYGDVLSIREDIKSKKANLGFADRFNFLSEFKNFRPDKARANICLFHCNPMVTVPKTTFDVKLLERHEFSAQAFIPMGNVGRYLVIVCLGGDQPNLTTLAAYVASGTQGVTYSPGVWHHPLVALDSISDFICLVWEDESSGDCEVARVSPEISIEF